MYVCMYVYIYIYIYIYIHSHECSFGTKALTTFKSGARWSNTAWSESGRDASGSPKLSL